MSTDIEESRIAAARASKGTSSSAIYDAVVRDLKRLGAGGDVLDFGAGTGGFTHELRSLGSFSSIEAVDLLDFGVERLPGVHWFFSDLNMALPRPPECYDVIVAVEVVEHLENARALAREWFRLLRPNGRVIFSTPNNESWRSIVSLIARGHFGAFTGASYPAHITALLRLDTKRLLTEAGFADIEHSFTHSGGIPGRPTVSWQQASLGLLRGLRYSDNYVTTARKPAR